MEKINSDLDNIYRVLEEIPYDEIIPHFLDFKEERIKPEIERWWNKGRSIYSIKYIIGNIILTMSHTNDTIYDQWKK